MRLRSQAAAPARRARGRWVDLLGFVREHWLKFFAISALIVVPCFWHREIAADDLGSHLYNAWLVQLIHRGQLPGLWLAHPSTNVLFDYMLSGLGALVGLQAGEKIAVAFAVLVFFWGTFAMVLRFTNHRSQVTLSPLFPTDTKTWRMGPLKGSYSARDPSAVSRVTSHESPSISAVLRYSL